MPDENTSVNDPVGSDAHFEQALAAALKEAPLDPEPAKAAPEAIQEAETNQAKAEENKAEAADKAKTDAEAAAKAKADEEAAKATPNPAGTLGKARRLFQEGQVKEAIKLALGVDLETVELSGKQWRGIKGYAVEAEQAARQAQAQAQQEVAQAQNVVRTLDPFIKGAQAYLAGDFETFLKLTTGDTPESFQRKLITSIHKEDVKTDPALLARIEAAERREAQRQQEAADYQRKYEESEKRRRYELEVTNWKHEVSDELKNSPFSKMATKPAFIEKVFALQEAHYNHRTKETIGTLDAAEMVWDELYGDVVPLPVATTEKVVNTARPGSSGEVPTTVKHTQTNEAAPATSLPWSPENQEKIMEEWARKARSEALQASL